MNIAVTGGAGYLGAATAAELRRAGHEVRALDSFLYGQEHVESFLDEHGVDVIRADLRDVDARHRALQGSDAVVHLAAIVGDPACAKDPALSREVNVEATRDLIADAHSAGVERVIFASTCSNYGRMADPTVPIDEEGELAPVSLYAEQKVEIERELLNGRKEKPLVTCLRFATLFGVAERMRFDLTVNEFTRELWADHQLEVFGELFWRPYLHVQEAARAIRTVLERPAEKVAGEVFNVGHSDENYRKLDLVGLITERLHRGEVHMVHREEDPRDYKVSFEKIRTRLGFAPERRVPDGIEEIIQALDAGRFGDPFTGSFSNS